MTSQQFLEYFNDFYGKNGIYPIRNVTLAEISKAFQSMLVTDPDFKYVGDSVDREKLRDELFTEEEIDNAYK